MQHKRLAAQRIGKFPALVVLLLTSLLSSCKEDEEPTYPIEPNIESAAVKFTPGKKEFSADTLQITFIYTDGDDNVGLDYDNPEHSASPFNEYFYYLRSNGEVVTSDKLKNGLVLREDLITSNDRAYPPYDTLPPRSSCRYDHTGLYKIRNRDFSNLMLDIYKKEGDENYIKYVFDEDCIFMHLRIPSSGHSFPLCTAKRLGRGRFEVVYKYPSAAWDGRLGREMRFGLLLKDRNLNSSNYLLTNDVVMQ